MTAALRDLIAMEQLAEHGVPPHEVADTWLEAFDPRSLVLDTDSRAEPPDDVRTTADQVCEALAEDGRNAVVVRTGTPDLERCGIHTAKVLFTVPSGTTSADGTEYFKPVLHAEVTPCLVSSGDFSASPVRTVTFVSLPVGRQWSWPVSGPASDVLFEYEKQSWSCVQAMSMVILFYVNLDGR
ncbi:hypothetical protein [Nocardiopsis sp. NPDC006832]|uniref:hypothetical protein n=1 Tax=Nocardiopsis sp. NPDC006832 TaxID=3157188 RepID=UPI0033F324CB